MEGNHFPVKTGSTATRNWICTRNKRPTRTAYKCDECNINLCIVGCFRAYTSPDVTSHTPVTTIWDRNRKIEHLYNSLGLAFDSVQRRAVKMVDDPIYDKLYYEKTLVDFLIPKKPVYHINLLYIV